jgi:hypothetical protein
MSLVPSSCSEPFVVPKMAAAQADLRSLLVAAGWAGSCSMNIVPTHFAGPKPNSTEAPTLGEGAEGFRIAEAHQMARPRHVAAVGRSVAGSSATFPRCATRRTCASARREELNHPRERRRDSR